MKKMLPVKTTLPGSKNPLCKRANPPVVGIPREIPESAIFEQGIPEEFPTIPDLGNSNFGNSLLQRVANSVYWYTTADTKDYWRQ